MTHSQTRLWQRRIGKKNRRSSCNCDFRSVCVKAVSESGWKDKTCSERSQRASISNTLLNKPNQTTLRHSSTSLSQRLSLGNVTFSQEKKSFSLIFSIPLHKLHTTEGQWYFTYRHLKCTPKYQSLLNQLVSCTGLTGKQDGRALVLQALTSQINRADLTKLTHWEYNSAAVHIHPAPGDIEKQPG